MEQRLATAREHDRRDVRYAARPHALALLGGTRGGRNGDPQLARQLYESVLIDDNFYSIAAAARLGQTLAPHPEQAGRRRSSAEADRTAAGAGARPRAVPQRHARSRAGQEWTYGFEMLPQTARPQAVQLAVALGLVRPGDRRRRPSSASSTTTNCSIRSRSIAEVRAAAQLSEPAARAHLQRDAPGKPVSHATPFLRPARAACCRCCRTRRVALRDAWKRPRPTPDDLFDPDVSVVAGRCASARAGRSLRRPDVVALAGYNAGPNAAARWIPAESIEPDVWIENIPYNETRTYVQRILWHNLVFGWLQDRRAAESGRLAGARRASAGRCWARLKPDPRRLERRVRSRRRFREQLLRSLPPRPWRSSRRYRRRLRSCASRSARRRRRRERPQHDHLRLRRRAAQATAVVAHLRAARRRDRADAHERRAVARSPRSVPRPPTARAGSASSTARRRPRAATPAHV